MRKFTLNDSILRHQEIHLSLVSFRALQQTFRQSSNNSLKSLLIKMGPFVAETDAFRFGNSYPLSEDNIKEVWNRFSPSFTTVSLLGGNIVQSAIYKTFLEGSIATALINEVVENSVAFIADYFIKLAANDKIPTFGRCGGMAFAGYDFYLSNWPVDERLGTKPPATGVLSDYIFTRLLDSLQLNVLKFLEFILHLHVMPIVSKIASATLFAALGAAIIPILGTIVGGYVGEKTDIFKLGGSSKTLSMTKEEWPKIKSRLDSEAACPVGLVYGDSANPTDQHQILSIGYVDKNDNMPILKVWNNNHKNTHDDLLVDFTGDELKVFNSGIQHPIKGFFAEEFFYQQPPLSLKLI